MSTLHTESKAYHTSQPVSVAGLVELARGERRLLVSGPEAEEAARHADVRSDVLLRRDVAKAVGLQQRLPPLLGLELGPKLAPVFDLRSVKHGRKTRWEGVSPQSLDRVQVVGVWLPFCSVGENDRPCIGFAIKTGEFGITSSLCGCATEQDTPSTAHACMHAQTAYARTSL